ncbi:MAG: hypothetical protein ACREOC_19300 [Gemmatimonadales bacterium]
MSQRFTVQHRDKPYLVALEHSDTAGPRWIVTLGGTAITALDARRGETPAEAARRLREWLDAHPGMDSRDDIHLGGG